MSVCLSVRQTERAREWRSVCKRRMCVNESLVEESLEGSHVLRHISVRWHNPGDADCGVFLHAWPGRLLCGTGGRWTALCGLISCQQRSRVLHTVDAHSSSSPVVVKHTRLSIGVVHIKEHSSFYRNRTHSGWRWFAQLKTVGVTGASQTRVADLLDEVVIEYTLV